MCSRMQIELNVVYKINFVFHHIFEPQNSHKILSLSLSLIIFYDGHMIY